MKALSRRIFRERRRLCILAVMSAVAGYLFFLGDTRVFHGIPMTLVASLGFAVGLATVALLSSLVAPLTRTSFEAYALSMLIYAIVSARYPSLALEEARMPLLNVSLLLIGTQVIYHLLYGDWLGKFVKVTRHIDRATAVSPLDREHLWLAMNPSPRTAEFYAEKDVDAIEPVHGRPDTLRIVKRYDNGVFREQVITFDQIKPGWAYRASYQVTGATDRPLDKPRRQTMALDPRDGMTAVHLRWERYEYPLNKALRHWIDDWAGRKLDQMVNAAEERASAVEPELSPAE